MLKEESEHQLFSALHLFLLQSSVCGVRTDQEGERSEEKMARMLFWPPSCQEGSMHLHKKLYLEVKVLSIGQCPLSLCLLPGAVFAINQTHSTTTKEKKKKKAKANYL